MHALSFLVRFEAARVGRSHDVGRNLCGGLSGSRVSALRSENQIVKIDTGFANCRSINVMRCAQNGDLLRMRNWKRIGSDEKEPRR
jgi:hypothetical protein